LLRIVVGLLLILAMFPLACCMGSEVSEVSEVRASLRCKYSVRDVAFVNVHPQSWQLQLVSTDSMTDQQFTEAVELVQQKLQRTNLDHVWLKPGSLQAEKVKRFVTDAAKQSGDRLVNGLPMMAVRASEGLMYGVKVLDGDLALTVSNIIHSPIREKILAEVCSSLCAIVLIHSGDNPRDARAKRQVEIAITQVEQQMWSFDKQTEKGPSLVVFTVEEQTADPWLLRCLQASTKGSFSTRGNADLPAVAIIYGQGRMMGEWLPTKESEFGERTLIQKIVSMASVCGRDCECDLDRNWLYGRQFLHNWTLELERQAESSLDFDPNSTYVKVEVGQILKKPKREGAGTDRALSLGGGLVIHDLDALPKIEESVLKMEASAKESDTESVDLTVGINRNWILSESEARTGATDAENVGQPVDSPQAYGLNDRATVDPPQANGVSWPTVGLLVMALACLAMGIWWFQSNAV